MTENEAAGIRIRELVAERDHWKDNADRYAAKMIELGFERDALRAKLHEAEKALGDCQAKAELAAKVLRGEGQDRHLEKIAKGFDVIVNHCAAVLAAICNRK